ncbi:MAG TPA: tail fiber protein [Luteimonas sp.]|nr:tail fiber protein [Luteimonas sp.]
MSEPYIGEIQLFGFDFAPRHWAYCNGAIVPIQQNTALYALLGTVYGGNGTTTFALPNLASRAACGQGQGPGLSPRFAGETFGARTATLGADQAPQHAHAVSAWSQSAAGSGSAAPVADGGLSLLTGGTGTRTYIASPLDTRLSPAMLSPATGGSEPHDNVQPSLGLNFSIALQGVFPSFG